MAILYEVLVPLSTAILIIINEPPGMARALRAPAYTVISKRRDAAHVYVHAAPRRRTMPRPRRRTIPTSIIDAPNLTSVRENPRQRRFDAAMCRDIYYWPVST